MTAAQQKMEIDETALENAHQGAHLLIVDDDQPWLNRLGRAMESRGYVVHGAASVSEGIKLGKSVKPAYAVVDMRLEDGNGLDVVENLRSRKSGCAHHHADRLRQYCNRGGSGKTRRRRLSCQTGRC